jgi:two-component system response regulator NreC
MSKKQRIFIVDDHTLLREGLRALLTQDPDLEVVGEADNGHDALRDIAVLTPDLVLMDISMRGMNGVETILDVKRRNPDVRILVLTIHTAEEYILASLRAGANGYMLKDATHDELRVAMRSILNGKTYLSPDISGSVIHGYLSIGKGENVSSSWDTLTHREREVLKLIAEGHHNKYISDYFCLSIKTVEKHRSNLMKKLDLHNASMLTSYAIERGLLVNSGSRGGAA